MPQNDTTSHMKNSPSSSIHPIIRFLPSRHKRAISGHPWIYSNELQMDEAIKKLPPGSLVTVSTAQGQLMGTAYINGHSLIAGRFLTSTPHAVIDHAFFAQRLRNAFELREKLFSAPYYRLVHAEADGLPGLIIDRYGDVYVVQVNTTGMDRLWPTMLDAIKEVLKPSAVVLKNDSPARITEGLPTHTVMAHGHAPPDVTLKENGVTFLIQPMEGQKTGWFYDHRDNRAFIAGLSKGARVLDLYTYAGGFGIQCAAAGAASVLAIDRSEVSLALARRAAELNNVESHCVFQKKDAFDALEELRTEGKTFDVVIADPPAFIKSRKDIPAGTRAYRKMIRMAIHVTAPKGFLLAASCSHHMGLEPFLDAVAQGLRDTQRSGRIVRTAGAGPDHPTHPLLPESAYLKAVVIQVD